MDDGSVKEQNVSTKSRLIPKRNSQSNGTLKIKKTEKINIQLPECRQTQSNHKPNRIPHRQPLHFEVNPKQKRI